MSEIPIEQRIADKEKELQETSKGLSLVHSEQINIDKQILDLRRKKKDFDESEQKARATLRIVTSELRVLKDEFWQGKGK